MSRAAVAMIHVLSREKHWVPLIESSLTMRLSLAYIIQAAECEDTRGINMRSLHYCSL